MTGSTHIAGGLLAAEILLAVLKPDIGKTVQTLLLTGAAVGSIMPDIDNGTSKISNKSLFAKLFGVTAEAVIGHRGMIHTPLTGALLSLLMYWLASYSVSAGSMSSYVQMLLPIFFGAGYLSHLVLDSLNPAGIKWFWPFKKRRYRLARIQPRSAKEWLILTALVIADVAMAMDVLKTSINFNDFF